MGSGLCAALSVLPIQWKGCVKEHMGQEKVKESSISEGIQIHKSVTKLSSEKAFEFLAETWTLVRGG